MDQGSSAGFVLAVDRTEWKAMEAWMCGFKGSIRKDVDVLDIWSECSSWSELFLCSPAASASVTSSFTPQTTLLPTSWTFLYRSLPGVMATGEVYPLIGCVSWDHPLPFAVRSAEWTLLFKAPSPPSSWPPII